MMNVSAERQASDDALAPASAPVRHMPGPLQVVRRAGLVLVVQVLGAGASFGLQVLLARLLGASHYGVYAYILVWTTFASLIAGLGFPAASIRFIPVYRAAQDGPRLRGYLQATSRLTFTTAIAMGLCGVAIALGLHVAGDLGSPAPIILGAISIPALAGLMLYGEFARAGERVLTAYTPNLLLRPLLISVGAAGTFIVHGSLSQIGALSATAAAAYVVLLLQYFLTRRVFGAVDKSHAPVLQRREWISVGMPLLAASAFTTTLMQMDIVVVGAIRGSYDAGIYAAASKTATLVSFVILAVNAAAAPQFASLWALGRIDELQRLLTKLAGVIFWPSLALSLGIAALSDPVLSLFGHEFLAARWALLILLVGQVINAAAGSVGYLLNLTGHHRDAVRALAWSAFACVPLTFAGVWLFGVVGAALASMLGVTMWNGWLYVLVTRKLNLHPSILTALPLRRPHRASGG